MSTHYATGLYGRLDKDAWFSTTVTNVDPTAKQSKVLHPYVRNVPTDPKTRKANHTLLQVQTHGYGS